MVVFLAAVFLLLVFDAVQVALLVGTDRTVSAAVAERAERLAVVAVADRPAALSVTGAAAVPAGVGRYDLTARLTNANEGWLADAVSVHFRVGGESSPTFSTFVLPTGSNNQGDRLLFVPTVALKAASPIELIVDAVAWKRIAARDLLTVPPMAVTKAELIPTTLSGGGVGTTAALTLKNQSDFGYRTVTVTVAVERAGTALALARTSAVNFRSGTTTTVNVTWNQRFPPDASLRVDPAVNPFDPTNRLLLSE